MNKKILLVILVMLCAALLAGCASQQPSAEDYPDIMQKIEPEPAPQANAPSGVSVFEQNPYDADYTEDDILSEEDASESEAENLMPVSQVQANVPANTPAPETTVYPYAGSTPIPLDPIDMPTPTPRPKLSFTYGSYNASGLGVSFEAPAGWLTDQSQTHLFILTEPGNEVKEGQACVISIFAEPITKNYSERDLRNYVKNLLNEMEQSGGYITWSNSSTATRHIMGGTGVYANYTATTDAGVQIGGRVLYGCNNRTLYGIEILFPHGYTDDYIDVFNKVRSTMKGN